MKILTMTRGTGTTAGRAMAAMLMATTALGASAIGAAPAVAQEARSYDIPAGALADVLNQYARQAGVELAYRAELTTGLSSPGLKGSYAPAEGLSRILTGSGITFRQTGPRAFTLEPAPQSADGAIQLGPVRVEGQSGSESSGYLATLTSDPIATEPTKSYAAPSVSIMKGATSLKDVPQSISVVTSQRIDDQHLVALAQVMEQAPGIWGSAKAIPRGPGDTAATYYSRGFQITSFMIDGVVSDAATGISGSNYGLSGSSAIYDRVEVLRGSAGLLVGAGAPGGTVNLVRKRPTMDFQQSYSLSAGSWNNFRGSLDLSGPLISSGHVRARVVAAYEDRDRYWDVTNSHSPLIYGIVEADLSPATRVSLGGRYEKYRENAPSDVSFYLQDYNPPRSKLLSPDWGYRDVENKEIFVDLRHDFTDRWKINVTASHRVYDADIISSNMTGEVSSNPDDDTPVLTPYLFVTRTQTKTDGVDASLVGSFGLFGREHKLTFGGSAAWEDQPRYQRLANSGPLIDGLAFDPRTFDPHNSWPMTPEIKAFIDTALVTPSNERKKESYAAYGKFDANLLEGLTLVVGGRVTWQKYKYYNSAGIYVPTSSGKVSGNFTPYAGLVYKLTPTWSAYASYADIFNPQWGYYTRNGNLISHAVGKNYELGLKGEMLDGRLTAALAVYQVKLNNAGQLDPTYYQACPGNPTGGACYIDSGRQRTRGFDAEITGEVLPGWQIQAGYTFTDSKILKADQNEGLPISATPKHMLKLFTSYRFDGGLDGLTLGGGVIAQSRELVFDPVFKGDQPGFSIWDLFARYTINEHWNASLNVKNIFDKVYWPNGLSYFKTRYGDARNFMFTVQAKF